MVFILTIPFFVNATGYAVDAVTITFPMPIFILLIYIIKNKYSNICDREMVEMHDYYWWISTNVNLYRRYESQ